MTSSKEILVYGAGGFAREVAWLVETLPPAHEVVAFIDDADNRVERLNDVPVLSLKQAAERHPGAEVALGVGSPSARRAERASP